MAFSVSDAYKKCTQNTYYFFVNNIAMVPNVSFDRNGSAPAYKFPMKGWGLIIMQKDSQLNMLNDHLKFVFLQNYKPHLN